MRLFNSNVALISFGISTGLFFSTQTFRSLGAGKQLEFNEEYLNELLHMAVICMAIAIFHGIIEEISEQRALVVPLLEDLDFEVLHVDADEADLSWLDSNNEYEQRLINAGYKLELLDIPNEYFDPFFRFPIMVNPVNLLTDDPRCSHTVDLSTYKYLMDQKGVCPFSGKKITGYTPNSNLKLLIETWVLDLVSKNRSEARQADEMHPELLKLNYPGTLFPREKEGNVEAIGSNNAELSM